MWTPILQMIAPLVIWLIGRFIKGQKRKDEMAESYYRFVKKHGRDAADKVAELIDLEKRLELTRKKLEALKEEEKA